MKTKILLYDVDLPESRPLSRFRSIFSTRDGIFNTIERVKIKYESAEIYYHHPIAEYRTSIAIVEGIIPVSNEEVSDENMFDIIIKSHDLSPLKILNGIDGRIRNDFELISKNIFTNDTGNIIGDKTNLFIHEKATVLPNSVFDTREGIIVIDEGEEITPFSYLAGPLYIGKKAKIDNARITGGCILGNQVRIGGEIENCLINDFSNKHHEGFLGHSVLGSWVNLGALTTTSDLKNNYGEVRISVPKSFYPHHDHLQIMSTGTIKFGSIIGDCSKTAIGTMINTGTIIDCGCNLFGEKIEKYLSPLSWGDNKTKYETSRFISDCKKIFARRNQTISDNLQDLVSQLVIAKS